MIMKTMVFLVVMTMMVANGDDGDRDVVVVGRGGGNDSCENDSAGVGVAW